MIRYLLLLKIIRFRGLNQFMRKRGIQLFNQLILLISVVSACKCNFGISGGVTTVLRKTSTTHVEVDTTGSYGQDMALYGRRGCAGTTWKIYTTSTLPNQNQQITKGAFWNFDIDFSSPVGMTPDPDYGVLNRDTELVVVTYEDANGSIFSNSWQVYYNKNGYYAGLSTTDQDLHRQYLMKKFCRRFLLYITPADWLQPTGSQFITNQETSEVSFTLNVLQSAKYPCTQGHPMCEQRSARDSGLTYSIEWKETGTALLDSGYQTDVPFKYGYLPNSQELKLYVSHTQALPASFAGSVKANGCYDLSFEIKGIDPFSSNIATSSDFIFEYCDCEKYLNFASPPLYKIEGGSQINPTPNGILNPFYDISLTTASLGTAHIFRTVENVQHVGTCGQYDLTIQAQTGFINYGYASDTMQIEYQPWSFPHATKQDDIFTAVITLSWNAAVPVPQTKYYRFNLNIWNCISNQPAKKMIILASMTFAAIQHDETFTDFETDLGISSQHCLASSAESFTFSSAPTLLTDRISNTANQMHVSDNYVDLYASAGSWSGVHSHGLTEESITLIICAMKPPPTIWVSGSDYQQVSTQSTSVQAVRTQSWYKDPNIADCPDPFYKWATLPSSDFDPLLSAATMTEDLNKQGNFGGWELWAIPGKDVTSVKLEFQILFTGFTSELGYTQPVNIDVINCANLPLTPPAQQAPLNEVSFNTAFSVSILWNAFTYTGYETFCVATHNKVLLEFNDGGSLIVWWKVSDMAQHQTSTQVGYQPIGKWFGIPGAGPTRGLRTQESYWSEIPKNIFFSDQKVTVQGGYRGQDGSTYFLDTTNVLSWTLTFKDFCPLPGAITIIDSSALLSINGQPGTIYVPSLVNVDVSLFETSPYFRLDVDLAQIDQTNVPVCGALTLSVAAQISPAGAALTHASVTQPTTSMITLRYDSWPSNLSDRSVKLELIAWHSLYPSITATKSIIVEEFDCSQRFVTGGEPLTPSSPILLNVHTADLRLTLPINAATHASCLEESMFAIQFLLPAEAVYKSFDVLTDLVSRPAGTFNEFDLLAAAGIQSKAGVYAGKVDRVHHSATETDRTFEMVLCWLANPPSAKFASGSPVEPFGIDVKGIQTDLAITMEQYTVNDAAKCGKILYEFKVTSAWDAIGLGHALVVDNKITFKNINQAGLYPLGKLTVTFNIRSELSTAVVYTTTFDIDVVDCLAEAFTVNNKVLLKDGSTLGGNTLALRFYTIGNTATFDETATFQDSFTFTTAAAQRTCSIWQYRITCEDNQIDLNSQSSLSHPSTPPVVSQSVYQQGVQVSSNSALCSKFVYTHDSVTFDQSQYPIIADKKDYEGVYKLTGEPIHPSNVPFSNSNSFQIDIKLNCDDVVIQQPVGSLTFQIQPTTSSSNMPLPWPINSDAIFHWMRSSQTYLMHGEYVNPHPYSCTLQQKLGEILVDSSDDPVLDGNGNQIFDTNRANSDLFISLLTGSPPAIKVESAYNKKFTAGKGSGVNGNEIMMMYEASLVGSTSRVPVLFKYFIFANCNDGELIAVKQTLPNKDFQIDGSTTNVLTWDLQIPEFASTFSMNDACPLTVRLESDTQTKAELIAMQTSSTLWISDTIPTALKLSYKTHTNTAVQVYDHISDTVNCDLSIQGQRNCMINYWTNVNSLNGTAAVQTVGTITVSSECLYIHVSHATQTPFWELSAVDKTKLNPQIELGYEVRDPKVTFELPFVKPQLASSTDPYEIFNRCGQMTYSVTIVSNRPKPDEPGIKITMQSTTDFPSADMSIETTDQSYALSDSNGDYRTKFAISLSAQFDLYKDEFTFQHSVDFYIRDYCVALTLTGPPDITALTNLQNITQGVEDADGIVQPYVNKISKHILTNQTIFELANMSYEKYRPNVLPPQVAVTTGCGQLTYTMTKKSWKDAWQGNDLMSRPIGSSYFTATGTLHVILAEKRIQIGDHQAVISVRANADNIPISTIQEITFELEILDCYVQSFRTGQQAFTNVEVNVDESEVFSLNEFVQEPACEFPISYTITLVNKPYGSKVSKLFPMAKEGTQPDPALIFLADYVLKIQPLAQHSGKGYAVFINGNLHVNSTIQGPTWAVNDQFDVQVPSIALLFGNSPPRVSAKISSYKQFAGEERIISMGTPYDMQLDDFWVQEWGVTSGDIPDWASFVNKTIDEGIKFSLKPDEVHIGDEVEFFYVLQDDNAKEPMSEKYKFTIKVVELTIEALEKDGQHFKEQIELQLEIIKVIIEAPDSSGYMNVSFSKYIKLPNDILEWTNENKSEEKILIDFVATEATQTILYDQDLELDMSWMVSDISKKSTNNSIDAATRELQAQEVNKTESQTLIDVNRITFKLNFTVPFIVSHTAIDSVRVEVLQEMFTAETAAYPADQALFVQQNKADYIMAQKVPRQHDSEMMKQVVKITEVASNSIMSFLGANMFVSLFSAGALQYLWGLINAMQMIVLTSLFHVDLAPNVDMIMVAILKMVSLEFISAQDFIDQLFDFRETQSFDIRVHPDHLVRGDTKFSDAGYESSNCIELLGPIFFIVCTYMAVRVLMGLSILVCKSCPDWCCTKRLLSMRKKQPVIIVRFVLEGCVEIGLSALIAIIMYEEEILEHTWETFAIIIAYLSLLLLVLTPIYYLKNVYSYLKENKTPNKELSVEEKKEQKEQARLFEDYRPKFTALAYPVFFALRRYTIIIILTILPRYTYVQIMTHMFITGLAIDYLWAFRPYINKALTIQEIINESVVLIATYPLLVFTDWLWDSQLRAEAGWAIIACIAFLIVFNIMFFLCYLCLSSKQKIKLQFIKRERMRKFVKARNKRLIQIEQRKQKEIARKLEEQKRLFDLQQLFVQDLNYLRPPSGGQILLENQVEAKFKINDIFLDNANSTLAEKTNNEKPQSNQKSRLKLEQTPDQLLSMPIDDSPHPELPDLENLLVPPASSWPVHQFESGFERTHNPKIPMIYSQGTKIPRKSKQQNINRTEIQQNLLIIPPSFANEKTKNKSSTKPKEVKHVQSKSTNEDSHMMRRIQAFENDIEGAKQEFLQRQEADIKVLEQIQLKQKRTGHMGLQ